LRIFFDAAAKKFDKFFRSFNLASIKKETIMEISQEERGKMKIKFLTVLSFALLLAAVGCRSNTNTNTTMTNTANTNMTMATATPMATMAPSMDAATKATVESAITKAGITGVMVDATTTDITLRGSVAKGKMAEAVRIANEKGGGKKVNNQLVEAK